MTQLTIRKLFTRSQRLSMSPLRPFVYRSQRFRAGQIAPAIWTKQLHGGKNIAESRCKSAAFREQLFLFVTGDCPHLLLIMAGRKIADCLRAENIVLEERFNHRATVGASHLLALKPPMIRPLASRNMELCGV